MGGRHEVGVLELEIVHRHHRQSAAHAGPAFAVVEAEEDSRLGADIEQALGDRIGADDAGDLGRRQVALDRLPGPPTVAAPEEVGLVVGELVARGGDIDGVGIVCRDLHAADIGEFRHAPGRHVFPGPAVVASDVHEPVVGRGPDLALPVRRFDDAGAGRMDLGAGAFAGDVAAGRSLAREIVEAEIGRDLLPAHAFVAGAEDAVAADVQRRGVMGREDDREGPGEAVLQVLRRDAGRFLGPHIDQLDLPRAVVVALQRARTAGARSDGADIDDVVVLRIDGDETALAGAGIAAVGQGDHAPFRGAGHRDRGVVLLGAIDPVGILVIDVEAIELRRLLVVDR